MSPEFKRTLYFLIPAVPVLASSYLVINQFMVYLTLLLPRINALKEELVEIYFISGILYSLTPLGPGETNLVNSYFQTTYWFLALSAVLLVGIIWNALRLRKEVVMPIVLIYCTLAISAVALTTRDITNLLFSVTSAYSQEIIQK